jgi:hypothetical protein
MPPPSPGQGFVGRGLAFPLRTDVNGSIATAGGADNLDQALQLIIATAPGERPMRPDFGCRIHDHIFAPMTESTIGTIAFEVERAVARWEPRVDVESVRAYADERGSGLLYIELIYRVKENNDERNLVVPFYVIPEGVE